MIEDDFLKGREGGRDLIIRYQDVFTDGSRSMMWGLDGENCASLYQQEKSYRAFET